MFKTHFWLLFTVVAFSCIASTRLESHKNDENDEADFEKNSPV